MYNASMDGMESLSGRELRTIQAGAIWVAPVAKAIFKVGAAVLGAASAYDGARDFVDGYQACR